MPYVADIVPGVEVFCTRLIVQVLQQQKDGFGRREVVFIISTFSPFKQRVDMGVPGMDTHL